MTCQVFYGTLYGIFSVMPLLSGTVGGGLKLIFSNSNNCFLISLKKLLICREFSVKHRNLIWCCNPDLITPSTYVIEGPSQVFLSEGLTNNE